MNKKKADIKLGKRIRNIRTGENIHGKRYSQKEFAKLIDSTVQALSNWENGRNQPNAERLQSIADIGGISVEELLGEVDERTARKVVLNTFFEAMNNGAFGYTNPDVIKNNIDDIVTYFVIKDPNIGNMVCNAVGHPDIYDLEELRDDLIDYFVNDIGPEALFQPDSLIGYVLNKILDSQYLMESVIDNDPCLFTVSEMLVLKMLYKRLVNLVEEFESAKRSLRTIRKSNKTQNE